MGEAEKRCKMGLAGAGEKCSEAQIVNWGFVVYQKIWKEFGLDRI